MDSIKKIKDLLNITKKKTYKINMYAEAILDDARVIATDSETFDIGAEVYVINDSGEVESISEGIYTLEDGEKIRIDAEGRVAGLGEEEVVVEEEEVVEEMAEESEAEKTDWAKTFEEMKDRVAELEKAVFGEKEAEETEELSGDVMGEVITRMNSMEEKFSKLENESSSNGLTISPNNTKKQSKIDLSKMSTKQRVAYFMNNN
jgi:hypothetical protein